MHETLGTLQYASKAKAIQNKVSANISVGLTLPVTSTTHHLSSGIHGMSEFQSEMESSVVQALKAQILQMQREMDAISHGRASSLPLPSSSSSSSSSSLYVAQQQLQAYPPALPLPYQSIEALIQPSRDDDKTSSSSSSSSSSTSEHKTHLKRLLRVISRISGSLKDHIHHLHSVNSFNEASCGQAWGLVNVCQAVVETLDEVFQQTKQQLLIYGHGSDMDASSRIHRSSLHLSLNESFSALKDRIEQYQQPSSHINSTTTIAHTATVIARYEDEIIALKQELEECQEDLKRDEDIFAEKLRELKTMKKKMKEAENENAKLQSKNHEIQQQIKKLASKLLPKKMNKYDVISHHTSSSTSNQLHRKGGEQRRDDDDKGYQYINTDDDGDCKDRNDDDVDDLDISIAVAVTEPDISQLMEDLEALAKEKEGLEAVNIVAEEKMAIVSHAVHVQKEEFRQQQLLLQDKISEYQHDIDDKWQQMRQLQRKNEELESDVERYGVHSMELQQECRQLRDRIREYEYVQETTVVRTEYDQKLQHKDEDGEDMLMKRMEMRHETEKTQLCHDHKVELRDIEEKLRVTHLAELEIFRQEYRKLTEQVEETERRQSKTLETLTSQISVYKKRASDDKRQMTMLEDMNRELMSRLDTTAGFKNGNHDHNNSNSTGSVADGKDDNYHHHHHHHHNGGDDDYKDNKRGNNISTALTVGVEGTQWLLSQINTASNQMKDWLMAQINEVVDSRSAKKEYGKLSDIRNHLEQDQKRLQHELQLIVDKEMMMVDKYNKKVRDINDKLSQLQMSRRQVMMSMERIDNPSSSLVDHDDDDDNDNDDDDVNRNRIDDLNRQLNDIEFSISSYTEHRAEIEDKLNSIEMDDDFMNHKQDLIDELETIGTELGLNAARMKYEQLRCSRKDGYCSVNADAKSRNGHSTITTNYNNNINDYNDMGMKQNHDIRLDGSDIDHKLDLDRAINDDEDDNDAYEAILAKIHTEFKHKKKESSHLSNQISSNELPSANNHALVKILMSMMITERSKMSDNLEKIKQLQQQYDDKCSEYDEVIKVMQRNRNESNRKLEQQSREADDKITFLLQQLRTAESSHRRQQQLHEEQQYSSRSTTPTLLQQSNRSSSYGGGVIQPTPNRSNKMLHLDLISNTNGVSRPSSAAASLLSSSSTAPTPRMSLRPSDLTLAEYIRADPSFDINREIERRWTAEKERRIQLEKRNVEMKREIKKLKEGIIAVAATTTATSNTATNIVVSK